MKRILIALVCGVATTTVFTAKSSQAVAGTPAFFADLIYEVQPKAGAGALPARLASHSAPDWRYRYHNGRWWYWTTGNRWVVWNNGGWVNYRPGVFSGPTRVVAGYRGPAYREGYRDGARDYRRAANRNTVRIGRFR